MKSIAVEKGLSNIKDYLTKEGYRVYEIDMTQKDNKDFMSGFDAVVLTGLNTNIMGIQTTSSRTPIIEASGLTPEDVKAAIERNYYN